jgi:hypothetical protein
MLGFEEAEWKNLRSGKPTKENIDKLVDMWEKVFKNPKYQVTLALTTQLSSWTDEFIDSPFTIRGGKKISVGEGGVSEDGKEALAERQNTETALKLSREMKDLVELIISLQQDLLPDEVKSIEKEVQSARELRKEAIGGKTK